MKYRYENWEEHGRAIRCITETGMGNSKEFRFAAFFALVHPEMTVQHATQLSRKMAQPD